MKFQIPPRVRITAKVTYEVLWTDAFANPSQLGSCDPATKQIVLLRGMKPKKAHFVFVHEVLHAISFECPNVELTETQVEALEISLERVARLNKLSIFEPS